MFDDEDLLLGNFNFSSWLDLVVFSHNYVISIPIIQKYW